MLMARLPDNLAFSEMVQQHLISLCASPVPDSQRSSLNCSSVQGPAPPSYVLPFHLSRYLVNHSCTTDTAVRIPQCGWIKLQRFFPVSRTGRSTLRTICAFYSHPETSSSRPRGGIRTSPTSAQQRLRPAPRWIVESVFRIRRSHHPQYLQYEYIELDDQ